ncbi:MAG: electron transport complex subunit RsxE [Burkholderiales bacterium]
MKTKTKPLAIIKNGIFTENPTFRIMVGMCPTLAISIAVIDGIGMGLAATFVLVGSNIITSLLRNFIPDKVRIPAFVLIIATFVTIVQLLLKGFVPALDKSLGLYIPLIVVNCIIIARAEAFAYKNTVIASLFDGIGMGIGFTLALTLLATIREVLGKGMFAGMTLIDKDFQAIGYLAIQPGGFITLGLLLGLINWLSLRKQRKGAR